ncbi:hypothetical protein KFK09_001753 [Dendrobium nobile]|uniref:Uncharacterized protein n=1 Tax=Dendrobium nobile TaxID=94219 RepID=A0A8T3C5P3_DENNO|nr:hypothetical protein KFK09_001753 [Dendrobium nobile]
MGMKKGFGVDKILDKVMKEGYPPSVIPEPPPGPHLWSPLKRLCCSRGIECRLGVPNLARPPTEVNFLLSSSFTTSSSSMRGNLSVDWPDKKTCINPVLRMEMRKLINVEAKTNYDGWRLDGIDLALTAVRKRYYDDTGAAWMAAHHGKQLAQFIAYFVSNIGKQQSCNFAVFNEEWIKYLAAFSNSKARVNLVYDAIKGNYNCLSKAAANVTTDFKPIVAWVDCNLGIWTFSRENYKLKYVFDAGGENVDKTIINHSYNVSNPDDMDDLYALLFDVVIDQIFAPEPIEYTLLTFLDNFNVSDDANFDFLINQSMWRYDIRVQNSSVLGSEYMEGEDGKLTWFNAAVSVRVGLGLGICLGVGIGSGLLVRTYKDNSRKFRSRHL